MSSSNSPPPRATDAAAAATALQETQFTVPTPTPTPTSDAPTSHRNSVATLASSSSSSSSSGGGSKRASRHAKKLSYGSIQNGYPSSAPSPPAPNDSSPPPPPRPVADSPPRILAPDLLRGLLMVLQSIDHSAMQLGVWRHGVAKKTEADSTPMQEWNPGRAWWARTATHLCAPGFMFLMGMGTVYFTRSRSKLGWSSTQLARHYAIRTAALLVVNQLLGFILIGSLTSGVWILNIVLVALALNYFIAGLLCLVLRFSEPRLAALLARTRNGSGGRGGERERRGQEGEPLLQSSPSSSSATPVGEDERATTASWHIHNVLLLALSSLSIASNILLSPRGGHCSLSSSSSSHLLSTAIGGIEIRGGEETVLARLTAISPPPPSTPLPSERGWLFNFLFYPLMTPHVISPFPPLAWTSFAVVGMVYARVLIRRRWSREGVVVLNLSAATLLSLLFIATRLLHFGNLSEACLHMPEHVRTPARNQYLASFRSFFYVVKYPPSLSFLCFTLAANFFLLAVFAALPPRLAVRIPGLMNFGSSALFFYALHFLIYKLLALPAKRWFGHTLPDPDANTGGPAYGVGDTPVYWAFWLLGLVILSPLCGAYGRFKRGKGVDSLWRFF